MSVKIRLSSGGAKKRPHYAIVVADSRYPRDGRFIEKIGTFDPMKPKDSAERVKLDLDRAKDWLSKGAQPTDRVERFLGPSPRIVRRRRNDAGRDADFARPYWILGCPRPVLNDGLNVECPD